MLQYGKLLYVLGFTPASIVGLLGLAAIAMWSAEGAPAPHRRAIALLCVVVALSYVCIEEGLVPPSAAVPLMVGEPGLLLATLMALGWRRILPSQRPRHVLFCGLVFLSIFCAWTGSMMPSANFPLAGLEALFAIILVRSLARPAEGSAEGSRPLAGEAYLWGLVAVLGAYSLWDTVALDAWSWRESRTADYELTTGPLQGWKCNASTGRSFDAAVAYLNRNVPREDSLFVFPDATVVYGATGHDSYRKAPFMFDHLAMPATKRQMEVFRHHLFTEPPTWILLHQEEKLSSSRMETLLDWLEIRSFLEDHYSPAAFFDEFALLRRREDAGMKGR